MRRPIPLPSRASSSTGPTATVRVLLCLLLLCAVAAPAIAADDGERVHLSLDRYAALLQAAQRSAAGQAGISAAELEIQLPADGKRAAEVTLTATVVRPSSKAAVLPLLPGETALLDVQLDDELGALTTVAGFHAVTVTGEALRQSLRLRYSVAISHAAAGRQLVIPLPPCPSAEVTIEGDGAGLVQVVPALTVRRHQASTVASVAGGRAITLQWGVAAVTAGVRAVAYSLVPDPVGEGVDVDVHYRVIGTPSGVRIRLARATAALVSAQQGDRPIATAVHDGWHTAVVTGAGDRSIRARLRLPIDRSGGQPQIDLALTGAPITQVTATVPGKRTVHFEPAVPIQSSILRRGKQAVTQAIAHLPPTESVTIRWTESRAAPEQLVRVNTETFQLVTIAEGVLRSRVVVQYEVIRGKLASLLVRIPSDVVVYKVTGPGVEDWRTYAAEGDLPRQVRISLAGGVTGKRTLELLLERAIPQKEGAKVEVPVVRPLGVHREMGVVALLDGDRVGFAKVGAADGFTPAGQDALPATIRGELRTKVSQAFRHIGPPAQLRTAVAKPRAREVRFDAHVKSLYHVSERTIATTATVMVEIKSGRRDHVIVSLPAAVAEPRITAPSLNKVEPAADFDAGQGRKAWAVRFTQELEGAIQLHIEAEMLLPRKLGDVALPDVQVHGAEVQQGAIALSAEAAIEVRPAARTELRPLDVAELPRALRRKSGRELLFGFRYAQAPWALKLDVKRHKTVQTLDAVITRAAIQTHVLHSGHVVSEARLVVANSGRQFLRILLPEGAQVLAVGADNVAIKAVQDEKGAVKIPLAARRKQLVLLRYQVSADALRAFGALDLALPSVDVRLNDLTWTVRTPGDRTLFGIRTDLKAADYAPELPASAETAPGSAPSFDVPLPMPESPQIRHFRRAVIDPTEEMPGVSFGYIAAPPEGLDYALLILAAALLIGFVRRQGRLGEDRRKQAMLAGAALAVMAKQAAFGWGLDEALLVAVLCAAAWWWARNGRALRAAAPASAQGGAQ